MQIYIFVTNSKASNKMKYLRRIGFYLIHRYSKLQLITIAALLILAFIISDSNIFSRLGYDLEIRELNNQIEYYRNKTVQDKERLEQLKSNQADIEKFARERFMMKKSDEDIFVVE